MTRLLACFLALGWTTAAPAKEKPDTKLVVGPGPQAISAEEAGIAPDPATGMPHAVVLLEEQDIDDSLGFDRKVRYHLRAKVLTNEGRDLANIEVPYVKGQDKIKEWWARTLLPDGRVLELPLEQAVQSTLIKVGRRETRTVRAALPGVVPGAVIDYGFVLHEGALDWYQRVDLQSTYPIRELRLHWRPAKLLSGAYRVYGAGLPVTSTKDKSRFRVLGKDLPPFVEEPWMPPDYHVRGSITLYYLDPTVEAEHFWDDQAKEVEQWVQGFLAGSSPIRDVIAGWNLPPETTVAAKLAHAYRWVTENVKRTGLLSFEELAAMQEQADDDEAYTAKKVLKQSEVSGWQVAALLVGFARALGADAHLALATDRREILWDPSLFSMYPFNYVLVAIGMSDDTYVLLDPGTGLDYGEVPWWTTGTNAMLCGKSGFKAIPVPPSDHRKNLSETVAVFHFDEEGTQRVVWTRNYKNLRSYEERRHLKDLDAHHRTQRLEELCRGGGELEVEQADSPGLQEKFGTLQLACALNRELVGPPEEEDRYTFVSDGPWIEPLPDFEGRTTRFHAALFHFGRVDKVKLSIHSPPGFAPGPPPPTKRIESAFGRYIRTVKVTAAGYEVERAVAFTPLTVPAQEYPALRAFLEQIRQADLIPFPFEREP